VRQFSKKQHLLCRHRLSRLMSKGWAPRTKGSHLVHTLASRLQIQKAKLNPYMVACDFIGYFIPQCYVTFFMFQFFKFYLSAMPSPPPATLSKHTLVCFFSGPSPCYRKRLETGHEGCYSCILKCSDTQGNWEFSFPISLSFLKKSKQENLGMDHLAA
jgi:hypothetical protein